MICLQPKRTVERRLFGFPTGPTGSELADEAKAIANLRS